MQYKRISADSHLDLPWMPPDLFTSMASRELKDRMPHVVDTDEGPKWVAKNGATYALGTAANFSFTPNDNGTYVVYMGAADKDFGTSSAPQTTIIVDNVALIAPKLIQLVYPT